MSLSRQIPTFRIVANSNNHDINVQNMDLTWVGEDFSDIETSVGGKKYKNMAGLRARVDISYDQSIEASEWRSLINDIVTDFVTNGVDSIEFYPDSTNTTSGDKIDVIPSEGTYGTFYNNQTSRFVPSISLVGAERATSITSNFEAP